ncbi:MAG: carboxypeptidase regulatory-like domain-containing protein [Acidobacteriota bacterium]|nr:carboxypeptidase regulatory-like domain-containing protein [Acidobacteriota bacterium]
MHAMRLALVLALASPAPQASQPRPPRPQASTGAITGHVFAADTGAPLRHASVRALSRGSRAWAQAGTDDQGRYAINDLPPGQYVITASKGGYVSMQFGQARPLEPVRPVDVSAGVTTERIDLVLPRGGVITGRIVDDLGQPVIDAVVSPLRSRYVAGQRRLEPAGRFARTDDRGQYRIYGLGPGQYTVQATWRDSDAGDSGDQISYAPTYYPGTSDPSSAARIAVQAGQEVASVDFALAAVPVATLSGVVVDSSGRPMRNARLALRQLIRTSAAVVLSNACGGRTRQDGAFTMVGVIPGDYTLVAHGNGPHGPEIGSVPVSLGGQDLSGVQITTSPGTTARGRIFVDAKRAPTFDPQVLRIEAVPEQPDDEGWQRNAARPADDGTFELTGLTGRAWIRVPNLPAGWVLESVRAGGADVTDAPVDFSGRDLVADLQVTLTDRLTTVNGGVLDDDGRPVLDYVLLVFPQDAALRGYQSRYVKAVQPDGQGRFEVRGLPPGAYLAAAVASIEDGEETDPDLLERLSRDATKFTLKDGETKTVTVRPQNASPLQ